MELAAPIEGRTIAVQFYRPAGPGPHPLVVLSHGSPANPAGRDKMGPHTMRRQAEALVADGVAVAVPLRRGYGGQGAWAEGFGTCQRPDYVSAGRASAEDIRAALAVALAQPGIDRARVALIGYSAGGWGSVVAATEVPVLGVVSFAGGRGSTCMADAGGEEALVDAAARFGRVSRAPQLWIYSRNDRSFGPDLAGRLNRGFNAAGGRAELVFAPAYRNDGHAYIDDIGDWHDRVASFLHRIGLHK
jgi:dienelactone hydrolase